MGLTSLQLILIMTPIFLFLASVVWILWLKKSINEKNSDFNLRIRILETRLEERTYFIPIKDERTAIDVQKRKPGRPKKGT